MFNYHLDWPSIVVGALFTVPLGILAIFIHSWISKYLETRKTFTTEKRKRKALHEYERIAKFRSGQDDIYLYAISTSTGVALCGILGNLTFLLAVLLPILANFDPFKDMYPPLTEPSKTRQIGDIFLFYAITVVLFFLAALLLRDQRRILSRYNDFSNYKTTLESAFGLNLPWPPPKTSTAPSPPLADVPDGIRNPPQTSQSQNAIPIAPDHQSSPPAAL